MAKPVLISDALWSRLAGAAAKRGQDPPTLVAELLRDHLAMGADERLFDEMRVDLAGRQMTDDEAVEFVRQVRWDRRQR